MYETICYIGLGCQLLPLNTIEGSGVARREYERIRREGTTDVGPDRAGQSARGLYLIRRIAAGPTQCNLGALLHDREADRANHVQVHGRLTGQAAQIDSAD